MTRSTLGVRVYQVLSRSLLIRVLHTIMFNIYARLFNYSFTEMHFNFKSNSSKCFNFVRKCVKSYAITGTTFMCVALGTWKSSVGYSIFSVAVIKLDC